MLASSNPGTTSLIYSNSALNLMDLEENRYFLVWLNCDSLSIVGKLYKSMLGKIP